MHKGVNSEQGDVKIKKGQIGLKDNRTGSVH